jgi:prepilin peptidase CpaA
MTYLTTSDPAIATAAGALVVLLGSAMVCDTRSHRIPNRLVLCGLAAAIVLNAVAPPGDGYFAAVGAGSPGLLSTILGAATGLAVLAPLYLLRAMGAGDVKLMAMTGAFLGPTGAAEAAVLTLALGGVLSLCVAAWNGVLRHALSNVRFMLTDAMVRGLAARSAEIEPALLSAGKVPYAIAIAAGTAAHIALARAQHSLF